MEPGRRRPQGCSASGSDLAGSAFIYPGIDTGALAAGRASEEGRAHFDLRAREAARAALQERAYRRQRIGEAGPGRKERQDAGRRRLGRRASRTALLEPARLAEA